MGNNNIIIGKNGYESLKANPAKIAILQEILAGKNPIVIDDGGEYENICQSLGIQREVKK